MPVNSCWALRSSPRSRLLAEFAELLPRMFAPFAELRLAGSLLRLAGSLLRLSGLLLYLPGLLLCLDGLPPPDVLPLLDGLPLEELLLPDGLPLVELPLFDVLPLRPGEPLLWLPELVRLRCWVAAAPRDGVDLPATVFFRPRVDGCFINQ